MLMARPRRTAAFVTLAIASGVSAAIYAQQGHVAAALSNVAEVTGSVLRRAGTPNDPLPGAWLSYGRGHAATRSQPAARYISLGGRCVENGNGL